jgi:hypothetical protein
MKSKILTILVFSILSSEFFSCSSGTSSDNPIQLIALAARAARVIADSRNNVVLQGTVNGPGAIQNATVQVYPTPTNGQCAKDDGTINGTPIASTTSDEFGNYSLKYKKTGSTVCVVVTPTGTSQIQVFSPATRTNIPTSWSKGNLMAVINEPATSNAGFTAGNKTVNVNPFTRMTARRFSALSAINPRTRSRVFLRVIPAAVRTVDRGKNDRVEFGNNTASTLLDKASDDIENAFFPNRDKATFSLESADPNSNTMKLRLGTIGLKADKLGGSADGKTSSEDLENVINFMEEDFSDGRFDGKKVDDSTGKIATMTTTDFGGVVASKQAADDFLKVSFKAAQAEYDSLDPSLTSSASDQLFCESDSLDAACSIAVLPGSPPEMWIFNPDEDFLDIGDTYDHGPVGFGTGGTASTREYTIINGGGSDLKITLPLTISGAQFTVISPPDAVVASGDATYFTIKFVPSSITSFSNTVTISSNDTLNSPYTFTVTGSGVNLSTNLQLRWAFDNTNANDTSGNNRTGVTIGMVPVDDLSFGSASFDGSGAEIQFSSFSSPTPTMTNQLTLSAWVAPSDLYNPSYSIINRDNGTYTDFQLMFLDEETLRFTITTGAGVTLDLDVFIDPDDFIDEWNLVTAVYDGANMRIYINGYEEDFVSKSGNITNSGNLLQAGNDSSGNYFEGEMDDIRVYNGALTAAQVYALYNQD